MKSIPIIAIVLILVFLSAGCSVSRNTQAAKQDLTRCQEDLNAIPEVAAALRARAKDTEGEDALNGMEIALTLNYMVRSKVDSERDVDDWCYTENSRENFDKLVAALKQSGLPPTVDFLTGDSLDQELQEEWLRSGNLIGNMSYTWKSVKKRVMNAQIFIESVDKTEQALSPLWLKFERKRKYFRYPALKLGLNEERPREVHAYLKTNSFVEVPGTINTRDYYFSQPYCSAQARGDSVCANFVMATFKSLLLDQTIKARAAARKIAGRDVKQIWSIGVSQLTCDQLGELLRWYKAMGVKFISLDEALSDPFYGADDVTNTANQIIWETKRAQSGAE
jgi:hypothetical protein